MMRAGKQSDNTTRGAGGAVAHRWRQWAERIAAGARRQPFWPSLDRIFAQRLARPAVERIHTVTRMQPFAPSIRLELALRLASHRHHVLERTGADGRTLSAAAVRRALPPGARPTPQESIAASVRRQVHLVEYRRETVDRTSAIVEHWQRTRASRGRARTDLLERLRRRSERVIEELPARVVHRRLDAPTVPGDDGATVRAPARRARGRAETFADSPGRLAQQAAPADAPFALDLRRVTDEVVKQIDHRLLARRERMGRV